ncbi:hypothetical protein EJ05DRAFT_210281 [Pseudovirgaria hyperparasitica]|uniref:Uncharacterized protein n=1 Tax=Pseudovirgaria hyperparasitica TaxID=470096 RepID=A0A6A6VRI7_9PEZI|nr:uncharacterized protein EJ05DRAFT_210281 [Pseudovirgaria hyperparasitica]KAF2753298.1 hypothetical protein EJ05DRAFT_210281 [Pseudovirgaria hyperparasitica]
MFLVDLTKNNDRHWLKMNDLDYRQSLHDFNSFLECLTQKIIKADETIPELPVKDIIFRIYRDVRFSKDPTPYKTHFSAAWSRTGRKGPYAGYYLHVQPGKCFVGSGVWLPEADKLAALRRDVDRKPHRLKNVLLQERIRSEILTVNSADEKKVVRTFVSQGMNKESALRTKPKGYENDHENIELLRLRNFTISKKLADKEVLGDKALERISFLISCMVPFVTYLNSIIMPDDPEESSSEDEDEVEDEGT